MATPAFDLNPSPQAGQGAFGAVPGAIGLPDPFADLAKIYPALGTSVGTASTDVLSQLQGNVSPGTMNALKLASAQYGQGSGMGPLAGLTQNQLFGNIAGFSEGQTQKGLANLASLVPTLKNSLTVSPDLQTEVASRNATMRAAPDPGQAASYAQSLFNQYLSRLQGNVNRPSGGMALGPMAPSGGTAQRDPRSVWPTAPNEGTVVGRSTAPAAPAPVDDWYTRTFGSQKFGGGAPGSGETYMGDPEADLNWLLGPVESGGAAPQFDQSALPGTEYSQPQPSIDDILAGDF